MTHHTFREPNSDLFIKTAGTYSYHRAVKQFIAHTSSPSQSKTVYKAHRILSETVHCCKKTFICLTRDKWLDMGRYSQVSGSTPGVYVSQSAPLQTGSREGLLVSVCGHWNPRTSEQLHRQRTTGEWAHAFCTAVTHTIIGRMLTGYKLASSFEEIFNFCWIASEKGRFIKNMVDVIWGFYSSVRICSKHFLC